MALMDTSCPMWLARTARSAMYFVLSSCCCITRTSKRRLSSFGICALSDCAHVVASADAGRRAHAGTTLVHNTCGTCSHHLLPRLGTGAASSDMPSQEGAIDMCHSTPEARARGCAHLLAVASLQALLEEDVEDVALGQIGIRLRQARLYGLAQQHLIPSRVHAHGRSNLFIPTFLQRRSAGAGAGQAGVRAGEGSQQCAQILFSSAHALAVCTGDRTAWPATKAAGVAPGVHSVQEKGRPYHILHVDLDDTPGPVGNLLLFQRQSRQGGVGRGCPPQDMEAERAGDQSTPYTRLLIAML